METNKAFIELDEFVILFRPLTTSESEHFKFKAEVVSDEIRQVALNLNEDIDKLVEEKKLYPNVLKEVTATVLARWITQATDVPAENLSVEGDTTFYNPTNKGFIILDKEIKRLGLNRQTVIELESRGEKDG